MKIWLLFPRQRPMSFLSKRIMLTLPNPTYLQGKCSDDPLPSARRVFNDCQFFVSDRNFFVQSSGLKLYLGVSVYVISSYD